MSSSNSKAKKVKEIIKFIKSEKVKTQKEIEDFLNYKAIATEDDDLYIHQTTVSRYLKEQGINRGQDGFYQISKKTIEKEHKDEIEKLIKEEPPVFLTNLTQVCLQTEESNASSYAYHLKELFPDVIVDLSIRNNRLLILVNLDAKKAKEFLLLLNNGVIPDSFEVKKEDG